MHEHHWFHGARPHGVGLTVAASLALVLSACTGSDGDEDTAAGASTSGAEGGEGSTVGQTADTTAATPSDTSGDTGSDDDSSGTSGEGSDPIAELFEFFGGERALLDLTGFRSVASGTRAVANEGQHAGDPAMPVGSFDTVTSYDFTVDAVRVDYERINDFLGGVPVSYAETYRGELGYISGDDGVIFPGPSDAPMLSSRWASGRKQLALLHPHVVLRDVLAGARTAVVSEVELEGCDAVIEVQDSVSPILLCTAEGGELLELHTMVNDFLLRDAEIRVDYEGWSGAPVPFPAEVRLELDGDVVHGETREVELDPAFDPAIFELPEEGMFSPALAAYGETSHQFFQTFVALGIPLDFPLTTIVATELSPGIHHLTGASHHSLVVEQQGSVIVIEAPNHPERAEAILAWIAENIPGKAVSHVIATHHHEDHCGGLRAFVAAGAQIVMHEDSVDYFADVVFTAPSTIIPDALSRVDVKPQMTGVGLEGLVFDDPDHAITLEFLPNGHSADMLLIHVAGGGGIVFVSDVYNPGDGGSSFNPMWAQQLLDALDGAPPTATLAGGHGSPAPVQELVEFVGGG
ncbi:MAG: MBL fold metallo-hydrolase [Myxococcota bacterium]